MKIIIMKKVLFSLLIGIFFLPQSVGAAVTFDLNKVRAIIEADDIVQANKNIIFDASDSFAPDPKINVDYKWDFGDKAGKGKGAEVVYSYSKPGKYLITLTVTQGQNSDAITKEIFVYDKYILLLTDAADKKDGIKKLTETAKKNGTYINIIESYSSTTAFMSEETLSKELLTKENAIINADTIAILTTKGSGINALTRIIRSRNDIQKSLKDTTIVIVSNKNLKTLGRIMQSNYNIVKPKQIVLTREHKLESLVTAKSADDFIKELKTGLAEFKIIDAATSKIGILNFISYFVNFMITQGIPSNTIVLLLMLPVIATIIAFLKQVIGVTTFGLYTPSIITLSFLALGLKFGLIILVLILITGAILRKTLEHVRLLHIPRIAIVFTISTLILLVMLTVAAYLNAGSLVSIAVFPMLIMTTLAEKFVSAQSGKGVWAAILLMIETTAVSLICYFIVEWQYLQNLMLSYPEIILLLIVINIILGKWTGLRFFEYIRFREVMKHAEE